jgi:hypothetical protein
LSALIEAFAGASVTLNNLNVRLVQGEPIDLSQHAQAVSAMVRVATRLGPQRRPRDVTLSLRERLQLEAEAWPPLSPGDRVCRLSLAGRIRHLWT